MSETTSAVVERTAPAGLVDIAPTVLDLMRLPQPEMMTGRSLIVHDS